MNIHTLRETVNHNISLFFPHLRAIFTVIAMVKNKNYSPEDNSSSRTHRSPACLLESPQWCIFPLAHQDQNTWLLPTWGNTGGGSQLLANPFYINDARLDYNTPGSDKKKKNVWLVGFCKFAKPQGSLAFHVEASKPCEHLFKVEGF